MPLFSCARIHAMQKGTLCLEIYDTMTAETDLSALGAVTQSTAALPASAPGSHWYNDLLLPYSLFKRGGREHSAAAYSDELIEHGCPVTDVFTRKLGHEKTARLFQDGLFGT